MKLKGKVAVITGGNSGIGLATAQEFKAQGAEVVIFGRTQKTLENAVRTVGKGTLAIHGDVRKVADLERLYQETAERFGKIDALVVNAGIAKSVPVEQFDEALFGRDIKHQFQGRLLYRTTGASTPERWGIHHSGDGSRHAERRTRILRCQCDESGAEIFGQNVRCRTAHRGIRVNALSPGTIETPIFGKLGLPVETAEWAESIPIKRIGTAEEMAKAALFLASSDSSYVLGAELVVDGGKTQI